MRHHNKNRKLGRKKNARRALLRSLACSLIKNEQIKTTEARAKELRPFIEKLVTKGRVGTIASRRLVSSRLGGNEEGAKKLVEVISGRYTDRSGGYTRVTKLALRTSDGSKMAVIGFVE